MANNYFQFKKFTVHQDKCSMKVCTDACILGAWIAGRVGAGGMEPLRILDIGTGTGLLSLMIAQKTNSVIDAVEIDGRACEQAADNFRNSPWSERLRAFHQDVRDFSSLRRYDLVIANPPFYQNYLLSPDENKNYAKHGKGLDFTALISAVKKHLKMSGSFAVLLPFAAAGSFEALRNRAQLWVTEKLLIRPTTHHDYFRIIMLLSEVNTATNISELTIKNGDGRYSDDFTCLMKDYYLAL